MVAGGGFPAAAGRFRLTTFNEFPKHHLEAGDAPAEMLSAADKSVVLVATIVATGLTLSAPLFFMAVLPGCIAPDPRCFDYAHELALAVAKSGDADPCDDFYRRIHIRALWLSRMTCSYVCGNFEDMYPGRSSYLELLKTRLNAYRDHLLDRHSIRKKDEAGGHVILAFRRCVDEYRENHDSSSALRVLLRNAGIQWSPEVLSYTHQDILGVLLRLSLELGVPVLLHAMLGPSLKHADKNGRVLNLDFLYPRLPSGASERSLSLVEDTLRLVAHNGTLFNHFRHTAAQVLVTLERLQSRLKTASPWHGGLRYVKFTEVHEHLLKFTEPGQFLSMTNSLLASRPSGAVSAFYTFFISTSVTTHDYA
ncbi:hypothetical protein HPB50_017032 [Hyalomma asiaticum]|uniref:Uncharacterized protein n=1 Tax=Hyalomma asiaticum TaxID=266040 RepID=A0ACB7RJ54_HYAAI|nr:hypothetical protein HPB50_017032 [Hyalomma asiaticum]